MCVLETLHVICSLRTLSIIDPSWPGAALLTTSIISNVENISSACDALTMNADGRQSLTNSDVLLLALNITTTPEFPGSDRIESIDHGSRV